MENKLHNRFRILRGQIYYFVQNLFGCWPRGEPMGSRAVNLGVQQQIIICVLPEIDVERR